MKRSDEEPTERIVKCMLHTLNAGMVMLVIFLCVSVWATIVQTNKETHTSAEPRAITIAEKAKSPQNGAFLPAELQTVVLQAAEHYGVEPSLVYAVIWVESRGKVDAKSEKCIGLMQLHEDFTNTFLAGAHVQDITTPENNIIAGTWRLAELIEKYGDVELALACYNLGEKKALTLWADGARSTVYSHKVLAAMWL